MKWMKRAGLAAVFAGLASVAQAVPVHWQTGNMMLDGFGPFGLFQATYHGDFIYDADTNEFSDIRFFYGERGGNAAPMSVNAGFVQTDFLPINASQIVTMALVCPVGPFIPNCGQQTFSFLLEAPGALTNAGGALDALVNFSTDTYGASGNTILTGTPVVPLPAGLPLLLTGLGALAWMRRRRS